MAELSPAREWWLEGTRLHLVEWGTAAAAPMLLVHGISGNAHNWAAFAERAARTRRLVALELRGHGESAPAEGEAYEHLDYLADLLAVSDHFGRPVPIVAHSIAGQVSLVLAALRPERVGSLVVVDIEAFPPRTQAETLRRIGDEPHPVFADLDAAIEDQRARLPGLPERALRLKARHDTVARPDGRLTYRFDRAVLRRVTAPDVRPYLPRIRCPVLIVRGEQSHVLRRAAAEEMAARIPRARVVEIPGATHWPQLENAEAFAAAVLRFLVEEEGGK